MSVSHLCTTFCTGFSVLHCRILRFQMFHPGPVSYLHFHLRPALKVVQDFWRKMIFWSIRFFRSEQQARFTFSQFKFFDKLVIAMLYSGVRSKSHMGFKWNFFCSFVWCFFYFCDTRSWNYFIRVVIPSNRITPACALIFVSDALHLPWFVLWSSIEAKRISMLLDLQKSWHFLALNIGAWSHLTFLGTAIFDMFLCIIFIAISAVVFEFSFAVGSFDYVCIFVSFVREGPGEIYLYFLMCFNNVLHWKRLCFS